MVRSLRLHPLRAGLVRDLPRLEGYPWTGHAALVGRWVTPWPETRAVLARFGPNRRRARARYRTFVAAGVAQGGRPDLQGGGLRRSLGGWEGVRTLRRGREAYAADERILGSSGFVEQIRSEAEGATAEWPRGRGLMRGAVVQRVCTAVGVSPAAVAGGGRLPVVSRARAGIAYLWIEVLGRSGRQLAPALGVRPESVYKAARRGRAEGARGRAVLETGG